MIQLATTRFGTVSLDPVEIIFFPSGLIGMEDHRRWVLLGDSENDCVGWLQNVEQSELAMPVVSPRRFVPEYRIRAASSDLQCLQLHDDERLLALILVSRHLGQLTGNLKAPLLINLQRRLGRQVAVKEDQPLRLLLSAPSTSLREAA